ncbi:MAG: monovalent cation/H+ antiporter subunit D family protein [Sandaracinaceae bacterium]|nr:monovalent cation/H+ antiporter subunit D family protein [Sandaracinaceae bacterium]
MSQSLGVGVALGLPVVGAALVALAGKRPNVREAVTGLTGLATFVAVAALYPAVVAGRLPELQLVEAMLPGVPLMFRVEPLGMLYALVAAGLWPVTSAYAAGYLREHHEQNQTRFFVCFALSIFAALGIAFAGNLATLFLFYEVLTLATFPLVTHHQTPEAQRAGRVYLGILMGTSVCFLLLAIAFTYYAAGTLDFVPGGILRGHVATSSLPLLLALFVYGCGKAALMPLHRWLPNAMVAPTPVSALLHAVAVVKAGVFAILKIVVYVFGLDLLRDTGASDWLMFMASVTILLASLIAFKQDNLKARLAYSTISQLAYIVLGAAMVTPDAILGGGLHIATHAVGKITLFFCAGAIIVTAHKTEVSQLDGLGKKMPITMAAFLIGSLSIIGLPPTGGSWSKWLLALGAAEQSPVLVGVLMLSSLLGIGYLLPIPLRAFFFDPPASPAREHGHGHGHDHDHGHAQDHEHGEAHPLMLVPLSLTAVGCLLLFFYSQHVVALLRPLVTP